MDEEKNTLPRVGADGPAPQEPEAPAAETATPENTPKPDLAEAKKDPQDRGRRTVFYGAAGAYLIYLAVQILRGVLGQTPVVWNFPHIAAVIAAVAFIGFGVQLIVRIARWYKQDQDEKKQNQDH